MKTAAKFSVHAMRVLVVLLGGGSMLLLVGFLFAGPFGLVDLGFSTLGALAWDAALVFAFCVQHSVMIRRSFRRRLGRFVPPHYDGAVFTIASGLVLLLLIIGWQDSGRMLVEVTGVWRWLLRAVFLLAGAGTIWGGGVLGADFLGLYPIRAYLRGRQPKTMPFVIRGPYRWVRHPLYSLVLVILWSAPELTADRLLLNVGWTVWMVVGTVLEERDLVADFGDAYRDYQRRVPMLIPWRRPHPALDPRTR